MSDKRIRTAIVGPGKVAHNHAQALMDLPESNFVAVCGRNRERAEDFATQYNLSAYTDVSKMVDQAGVEMVVICTPHPAHVAPAIAAIRYCRCCCSGPFR